MTRFYFQPREPAPRRQRPATLVPDARGDDVYVYGDKDELVFAVNMALATGRPLLLLGPSGSGKSSLASSVAHQLGWTYQEYVVTAATQARDLCWRFDAVSRLADAQAGDREQARDAARYVVPGVLWAAFDPAGARAQFDLRWGGAPLPGTSAPLADPAGTVVLIDELDKADPSVPNDLLIPLGSREFTVEETGVRVRMRQQTPDPDRLPFGPVLVVITSNAERQMPDAFGRRCIAHVLEHPDEAQLLAIARAHFGAKLTNEYMRIAEILADLLVKSRADARGDRRRRPSTAEYLDALRAARAIPADEAAGIVKRIAAAMFDKPTEESAFQGWKNRGAAGGRDADLGR